MYILCIGHEERDMTTTTGVTTIDSIELHKGSMTITYRLGHQPEGDPANLPGYTHRMDICVTRGDKFQNATEWFTSEAEIQMELEARVEEHKAAGYATR